MLIGFGQPAGAATVAGGTAINLGALTDGRPSSVARVHSDAGLVRLRLGWASPAEIRIAGLLGLSCAAGTPVRLVGRRAGQDEFDAPLGGNSALQPVIALSDDSLAAWFIVDRGLALTGVQFEIEASDFDAGELVAMPAVEIGHQVGWSLESVDPSVRERTLGSGLNVVARRPYRVLRADMTPLRAAEVRAGGLGGGMDLERLRHRLSGGRRVVAVPRWGAGTGVLDVGELHATALYGQAALGAATHLGGDYYGGAWTFEESPPL